MDLLESGDEREDRPLGARLRSALRARPPAWVVAALGALVVATLGGGLVGAVQVSDALAREAARVDVRVLGGSTSSTVGGLARGSLRLQLVNRRNNAVQLAELEVVVEGLRVLEPDPPVGGVLGPFEERSVRLAFVVPSCDELVLPGTVSLRLVGPDGSVKRRQVPVYDPSVAGRAADGIALAACPPSARGAAAGTPTDVAVRPAGGEASRSGAGAEGFARLEVRNAGAPVKLLAVDARVPGVAFAPRVLDGGRTIVSDGLVIIRLGFFIEDCARLRKAGWLVLRVERFDGVQELGLRLTAEPAGGLGPELDLRVVLDACD